MSSAEQSELAALDHGLTLLLGLVSKHGSESDISDALDALDGGVELGIDDDATLVVDLDADLLKVEALGYWPATDSDENNIGGDLWEEKA